MFTTLALQTVSTVPPVYIDATLFVFNTVVILGSFFAVSLEVTCYQSKSCRVLEDQHLVFPYIEKDSTNAGKGFSSFKRIPFINRDHRHDAHDVTGSAV